MLSMAIHKTHVLKDINPKASFYIAKELAVIEVNIMWFPEKINDHVARLYSLSQHVLTTFKNNDDAKVLAVLIRNKALKISSTLENKEFNS